MKSFCLLVCTCAGLLLTAPTRAQGQSVPRSLPAATNNAAVLTGIWRGYFVTSDGQQYKLEFQVDQQSRTVRGVSYSYLDTRFYGKSIMSGTWNATTKSFMIEELRTVELRNQSGSGTCLMNYRLTFTQSGSELFLEGTYLGRSEDRTNPKNNGKWGDCGDGRVFLRRVESTEFPEEAFLKKKSIPRRDSATETTPPVAKKTTPPRTTTPANATPPKPPVKKTTPPVVVKKSPVKTGPSTASTPPVKRNSEVGGVAPQATDPVKKPDLKPLVVPAQTRNRENATARVLQVHSQEILIKLYDNGEVDDDTISVYVDNKLTLANKRLSASPIELRVKLDETSPEHVVVLVAENMGRIPPNTSLMIIYDGEKRYDVQITSTELKNAMVRFRYAGAAGASNTE